MSEVIQLGNCMAGKRENPNQGRVYDKKGICPTLTGMTGGNRQPMIIESIPILISRDDGSGHLVNNPSVEKVNQNCANSLRTNEPGLGNHHSNMVIVAMRNRNPDNLSDRTPGITTEPKLVGGLGEKVSNGGTQYYNQDRVYDSNGVAVSVATSFFHPNYLVEKTEGICNTLTTVQKDNLVLENKESIIYDDYNSNIPKNQDCIGTLTTNIGSSTTRNGIKIIEKQTEGNNEIVKIEKVGQISNEGSQCGTVVNPEGLYPTISAGCHGYANPHIVEKYRIRKLTPRECFRLMNVEEEQFNKAEKVVSNSQLYKVAGNAIVVSCLIALFSQLGIQGKKKWNDMTEEERIALVHKNTVMEKKEINK